MEIARAVPTGGPRYYYRSASCRCIRMREYADPPHECTDIELLELL